MKSRIILLASTVLLFIAGTILAQSGGGYDLEWSVIGSAGDQFLSGGGYQLGFTLAPDQEPGISTGGSYQVIQGYWFGGASIPTAVVLADLWVEARGDALVLGWQTASELDVLGFDVYRSLSPDPGEWLPLNEGLILAQAAGSPTGASYEWIDASPEPGQTYFYWLEAVDVQGRTVQHGPVQDSLPAAPVHRIYLPAIRRGP